MRNLCVFCGSSTGIDGRYLLAARELGGALAARGVGLVYGGAGVGLMGALADAVLEAGGDVVGVIPESLERKEVAHRGLRDLRVVSSMHERKALMAELADGFVALPGGIGTLEELFEVWTWAHLGYHAKPCAIYNVAGFYTGLTAFLDHVAAAGFLMPQSREMLIVEDSLEHLLARLGVPAVAAVAAALAPAP